MLKVMILFASVMSLNCASTYKPRNWTGGYYNYNAGDVIVVGFAGNAFTPKEQTEIWAHQRAAEVCPRGYQTLQTRDETIESRGPSTTNCSGNSYSARCTTSEGNVQTKPDTQLRIKCN